MAIEKKYDEQMPFVGTRVMKERLDREANDRRTSVAKVIRDALDERYLLVDGEDVSLEERVDQAEILARRAQRRADDLAAQLAAQRAGDTPPAG